MMKTIELIWQKVIPIRHKVLWPTDKPSNCAVEGYEDALHFSIIIDTMIICVASIYLNKKSARLRKLAVLNEYQGQGLGSFMIDFLFCELKSRRISYLWLDARKSAINFYKEPLIKS